MEYLLHISRSRVGTAVTFGDLVKTLAARGADPTAGVAQEEPPPPGAPPTQKPTLRLAGTALLRSDKLAGFIDDSTTDGLLWLRGENHRGALSVEVPQTPGHIAIEWTRSTVKRWVGVERGRIVIHVKVTTEGDVGEESATLDLSDPNVLQRINEQMSLAVRRRMETALDQMWTLGTDSAGFGELVHQQLPAVWKRVEKQWRSQEFQRAKVVLDVDARVRRTGLSGKPRGFGEDELVK